MSYVLYPLLCFLRLQVGRTQHVLLRALQQEGLKQHLRLYHHVYLFACKHKKHEQTIRASSVLIECQASVASCKASSTIRAKQNVYPSETAGRTRNRLATKLAYFYTQPQLTPFHSFAPKGVYTIVSFLCQARPFLGIVRKEQQVRHDRAKQQV